MGRSIYCSKCKQEKEAGRDNESCCKSCKSEAGKARRAKKRAESGRPPLGSGRSPNCYACGKLKENQKAGYCHECERIRDNEWRLRTGRTKRHRTGMCRCGKPFASYSKCYCRECATNQRKKYLNKNPEKKSNILQKQSERRKNSNLEQFKQLAREMANKAVKAGRLTRKPCEVCGINENIDAHHDDYARPLEVRWLCKPHHAEHHKNTQEI